MMTITERAKELFVSSSRSADTAEAIRCLGLALDEYQASVEERMAKLTQSAEAIWDDGHSWGYEHDIDDNNPFRAKPAPSPHPSDLASALRGGTEQDEEAR